ncbi:MAG: twin transmembrane helix small protein [Alphaproteobacteria bacterium]|nr:twin transmembrane helix small protein [Alphaproteobacteria bacterium]
MNILIILVLIAVAATLLLGVFSMAKGGEFNRKYSNKLMQLRVGLQALAVLLLLLFLSGQ